MENTSFHFFRICASFRNFHLVKEYPLAFIADYGLGKVVLRAGTCVAIIELYRKKIKKLDFCYPYWGKSGFLVSGVFLAVIFGTGKLVNA